MALALRHGASKNMKNKEKLIGKKDEDVINITTERSDVQDRPSFLGRKQYMPYPQELSVVRSFDSTRPTLEIEVAIDYYYDPSQKAFLLIALRIKHPYRDTIEIYIPKSAFFKLPSADIISFYTNRTQKPYWVNYVTDDINAGVVFELAMTNHFEHYGNIEWLSRDTAEYILETHKVVLVATGEDATDALLANFPKTNFSRIKMVSSENYRKTVNVFNITTTKYTTTEINNAKQKLNSIIAKLRSATSVYDRDFLATLTEWQELVLLISK